MKQGITSFLLIGASVGAIVGLIGVGERMPSWPPSRTFGAIGGLALLGALVSLLLYVLWSASKSPAKSEEVIEQDVADYPFEGHHHSSSESSNDLHHD